MRLEQSSEKLLPFLGKQVRISIEEAAPLRARLKKEGHDAH